MTSIPIATGRGTNHCRAQYQSLLGTTPIIDYYTNRHWAQHQSTTLSQPEGVYHVLPIYYVQAPIYIVILARAPQKDSWGKTARALISLN